MTTILEIPGMARGVSDTPVGRYVDQYGTVRMFDQARSKSEPVSNGNRREFSCLVQRMRDGEEGKLWTGVIFCRLDWPW